MIVRQAIEAWTKNEEASRSAGTLEPYENINFRRRAEARDNYDEDSHGESAKCQISQQILDTYASDDLLHRWELRQRDE